MVEDALVEGKGGRLSFLDGLRGWGALAVVLNHLFVDGYPPTPEIGSQLYKVFLFNGPLAVVIFFIVSGFSLSIGFIQTGDRRKLEYIIIGRYFRLTFPILLAVLLTYICAQTGLLTGMLAHNVGGIADVFQFSLFNVYFNNAPLSSPIPPLWTMPIELGGSVLTIGLLWFIGGSRWRYIVYIAVIAYLLHRATYTQAHFAAFVVGLIFADVYRLYGTTADYPRISKVAALLIPPALIAAAYQPSAPPALSLLIAALIAYSLMFSSIGHRILSNAISRFLGRISFTLYLTHALVMHMIVPNAHLVWSDAGIMGAVAINVATAACAVALAWPLRFIDRLGILVSHRIAGALVGRRQQIPSSVA